MNLEDLMAAMQVTAARKPVPVTVLGWGDLFVKPPTVEEIEAASDAIEPEDGKKRRYARGAARLICNEQGERIFDPANEAHVDLIAKQPWSMLQKVMAAAETKGTDDSGN
jgi:hypothetical protein